MIGCCVAAVLARLPGASVQLVDINPERAGVAAALGVHFATPENAEPGRDVVIHASATAAGLQLSLGLLAREGTVTELSWYGDREVTVALGGSFHSGRLRIQASQVGMIAPARRANRTYADRLSLALDLLGDPAYDALLSGESSFDQLPDVLAAFSAGTASALAHVITYSGE
jgi:threonine dehydrogenase-like Zn-dependent dehydrogenase